MGISENIKILRERYNLSQKELAEIVSMSDKAVSTWESGTREPKMGTIEKLASHFGLQKSNLIEDGGMDNIHNVDSVVTFDVIGSIAAGYDGIAQLNYTGDKIDVPSAWLHNLSPDSFFMLQARGNSMMPKIEDGDYLMFRRCSSVDTGTIAAVLFSDESATVKIVHYNSNEPWWMELEPINKRGYSPIRIENEELEHCRILGQLYYLVRNF